jgi:cytochrome d ubiquinol oxidase subunit I
MTFPAFTVGLSIFLSVIYGMYWRTHKVVYYQIFKFFRKIFAVGFALGVVAGIVITFQFGLNWGVYAAKTGPIIGPIIAMEVATAFFVEATFLGVLLYGDGKVRERTMFWSSVIVAFGTVSSSTWILVANSWMQTPAGFKVDAAGRFVPVDWLKVIFNPSFGIRWIHIFVGVLVAASMLITGISAYYFVKKRETVDVRFAKHSMSIGLGVLSILIPIQLGLGDTVASTYVYPDQIASTGAPSKLIAMEGHWHDDNGYLVAAWPDQKQQKNLFEINIPYLGSVIAGKDWTGKFKIPGMDRVPKDEQPYMWFTFLGFRMMFYSGVTLFITALIGLVKRRRGTLYSSPRYAKWLMWIAPLGIIAVWGGWITAETGRQPWVVWGQLRTADAVSSITTPEVVYTLISFIILYGVLLTAYVMYVIRTVKKGPESIESLQAEIDKQRSLEKTQQIGADNYAEEVE